MADLNDASASILEMQVYEGTVLSGASVELAVTLLDIGNDALPMSKPIREQGAQAYGMIFFKSGSARCPKQGVIWERFEDGMELMVVDEERHLFKKPFQTLCIGIVATFLVETAKKDAKYAWLVPPHMP